MSWRETTMRQVTKASTTYFVRGPVCRWTVQKMPSESSEKVRKTTNFFTNSWRIKITLESYFEEHAQEVWEKNWMNLEMQTTLLNRSLPKLIATILKALREQLKENDQLIAVEEIAGPAPEIPLEYDQILKGRGFWMMSTEDLSEDLVLIARREEIEWVHSEGVYEIVPMQDCKDAGKNLLELIWQKIRSRLCTREYKTRKQGNTQRVLLASQLFSARPPHEAVKALVNHDVCELVEQGKPPKLRYHDNSRAYFQGTAHKQKNIRLPAEDRQECGEDQSMCGTQDASHICQFDNVTLIYGMLGGFGRGKHSAALFHKSNEDVRMAVLGDDFVCVSDDDGLQTHRGNTEIRRTRREKSSVVEPCV